jgi:hypothetical protein
MSWVILKGLMSTLFDKFFEEDVGFRFMFIVMLFVGQKTFMASPFFFPCNMSLGISIKKD